MNVFLLSLVNLCFSLWQSFSLGSWNIIGREAGKRCLPCLDSALAPLSASLRCALLPEFICQSKSVAWCVDSENPLRILLVYFTVGLTVDGRPNDPLAAGKYPGAPSGQSASALEFIEPLSGFRKLFALHRHPAVLQLTFWISNLNKHCNIHHWCCYFYINLYFYIYFIVLFLIHKNVSRYFWMCWKVALFWKARAEAVYLIVFNFEV